jgi:lysophospholipase L1-like esterase
LLLGCSSSAIDSGNANDTALAGGAGYGTIDPQMGASGGGQGGAGHAGNGGAGAGNNGGAGGSVGANWGDVFDAAPHDDGDAARGDERRVDAAGGVVSLPCVKGASVVMPLGDSITQGANASDQGGYRSRLFHLAHEHGQTVKFVGSMNNGPATVDGQPFPTAHEGHPGFTIDGDKNGWSALSPLVPRAMKSFQPQVILLMIGTNDVLQDVDLANAPERLAALLDEILNADPNVCLVVAQATPLADATGNARIQAYDAEIPALVASRAALGKHIGLVDMYGAFAANASYKTQLLQDGIHSTAAGYELMATVWYAAIADTLE